MNHRKDKHAQLLGGILAATVSVLASCDGSSSSPGGASAGGGNAWFEEVAAESGIVFSHQTGFADQFLFPETITGGAALFDMDGDGDLDAYLVQGGDLASPASEQPGNMLFRNVGNGRFEDATVGSGADDRRYGMGVAAGDYDGDGDLDLYITNIGSNRLLQNDGSGVFVDVTDEAGVGDDSWGATCAFLDYDSDGDLDLFVTNYVVWTQSNNLPCFGDNGAPDYCSPKSYNRPYRDTLYRNEGDGTFSDVSEAAGIGNAFGNGLGVVTADFNNDNLVDIFVANDGMLNQLWENQGNGSFRDVARQVGTANDAHGLTKAGMGTDASDVDDDGDFDLMVVNLSKETDSFFRNEGGYFSDETAMMGLSNISRRYTRWGMAFIDFDHDGLLDIYQTNGRVARQSFDFSDNPYAEPNVLMRGIAGGRFEEVEPKGGVATDLIESSRGTAFGDVDNDGDIDILICNQDGPAHLLRNIRGDGRRSVVLRVLGDDGLPSVNAIVYCDLGERSLMRQVKRTYSFQASNDPRVHVGLGDEPRIRNVRVRWPDGSEESFGDINAGDRPTLRKGEGSPAPTS